MDKLTETISVTEITGSDILNGLYNEWLALWQKSSLSTPFQSPAWIIPWWKIFGQGRLSVICLYHEGRLIAVAPFYIYRLKETGQRQLTIIGTGNTDYMDIIAEDKYVSQAAETILSYITEHSSGWDICYFQGLRECSALANSKISSGFISELSQHSISPAVSLPDSFENYFFSLPVSFRKNIKRARNNLKNSGSLSYQTADLNTFHEFMNDLFMLHEKSWNERNGAGVLKSTRIKEFHKQVAENLLKCGALRLCRLRYNDRTIASVYSMLKSGRLYYYIGGFEPEMKKYSPGSLLTLFIVEELIDNKIQELDFLSGAESYKYKWGAKDKTVFRMIIRKGF